MPRGRKRTRVPIARRRRVLGIGRCCYCGNVDGPFWVEHRVPVSRGGTNELDNLDCACAECNFEKGDLLVEEWEEQRRAAGLG
ncbi:HNH endonuclease [Micromonospora pisi]|uniref:HNH endonuclease n=1 Tax=Micromonospora pisi TaxID=589240 RepID=UPI000EB585E2